MPFAKGKNYATPQRVYEYTQSERRCQPPNYGGPQLADEATFEGRLRRAIKTFGKQNVFAEAMGVRAATVSNWVRGKSAPELDQLLRIIAILGIDAHWLLTGEGEMKPVQRSTAERAFEVIAAVVDEARAISAGGDGEAVLARYQEVQRLVESTRTDQGRRKAQGDQG